VKFGLRIPVLVVKKVLVIPIKIGITKTDNLTK
jgi:hypothetical protein